MERDEYLPSRRVVAGIRAASAGFPLDLFVVFATWSPWARRVYKAFASSYKNGLQGVSTGFSAFPVDPPRRFVRHVTALRSSRRDRAPRRRARLDVGLG